MRPTERPSQPMSLEEIKRAVHQHFVVEKNPICTDGEGCFYGETGCFVGCLFTAEDADSLDNGVKSPALGGIIIENGHYRRLPTSSSINIEAVDHLAELMNIYFEPSQTILWYLSGGQVEHDGLNLTRLIDYINNQPPVNGF